MRAYLTGREIKNCLEFFLPGNPNLPGQYYPRVSGMRFRYDLSRPRFDAVPVRNAQGVTLLTVDDRATEVRAINVGR